MIALQFEFVNPEMFWLLLLIPIAIGWYIWQRNQWTASVKLSSVQGFKESSFIAKLRPVLLLLRLVALAFLVIALARPRYVDVSTRIKKTEGIDIVMAIDISASMLARDLRPNRLEALKKVASEFVMGRPNDRIGIVIYAGESYTQTPLTIDKRVVINAINDIRYTDAIEGGTAIGMGLATAVNRLKESPSSEGRVVILLTDGENNSGFIDPNIATELAVQFGVKVYSIGLGTTGMAMAPVAINPNGTFQYAQVPVVIDEALLQNIAEATGGLYFRADDNQKLKQIYDEINKLEKTEIEELQFTHYDEKYRFFALWGGLFLLLEIFLKLTVYRSFI